MVKGPVSVMVLHQGMLVPLGRHKPSPFTSTSVTSGKPWFKSTDCLLRPQYEVAQVIPGRLEERSTDELRSRIHHHKMLSCQTQVHKVIQNEHNLTTAAGIYYTTYNLDPCCYGRMLVRRVKHLTANSLNVGI